MTVAQTRAARRKAKQDRRWSKVGGRKAAEVAARKRAAFASGKKK